MMEENNFLLNSIDQWENRPAQLEEINQVIYNHRTHDSWYCFDTAFLLEQQSSLGKEWGVYNSKNKGSSTLEKELKDVRYDFLIVNTKNIRNYKTNKNGKKEVDWSASGIEYTFSVRNTLWDGTYHVSKSITGTPLSGKVEDIFIEPNELVVMVYGKESKSVKVCFHMTQTGSGRSGSNLQILNETVYEEQFDKSFTHQGIVIDTLKMNGFNNVKVTLQPCDSKGNIISMGLPTATAKTNVYKYTGNNLTMAMGNNTNKTIIARNQTSGGIFNITYGKVDKPGEYYVMLTATYTVGTHVLTSSQIVKVNKIQENTRAIDWGDTKQFTAYKGSIKTFYFGVNVLNKYGQIDKTLLKSLSGQIATVTFTREDGSYMNYPATIDSNGKFNVTISYRKYYANTSKIQILIHKTESFDELSGTKTVNHTFFKANSFDEIRTECNRTNGADYIMVYPKTMKNYGNSPITITRDQTIVGMTSDTTWSTLDGNNKRILQLNEGNGYDAFRNCTVIGIKFTNGHNAIYTERFTKLTLRQCYFTNNQYPEYHYSGTCICNTSNDEARNARDYYKMDIQYCYFYNNYGNEIRSLGTTNIKHCLFKTNNWVYLKQPEPKVIIVESGDVTYAYNKSYINVGRKPKPMNHSYAKALTYVGWKGTFNGKGPSALQGYNTLPLYKDYHNQAYTYAIYYYPYDRVKTEIVCNPKPGHERKATGHASAAENWVYYDGYQFFRWNKGGNYGNTKNPWTDEDLNIPANGGVYNDKYKYFTSSTWIPDSGMRSDDYKTYKWY